jgi:hypothetical protein
MANVKISELTPVPSPLSGTEELPLVQSLTTYKVTAQDIADLAGGGTANYGVGQVIGASGSPSATFDLTVLFPSVVFTNKTVSMQMQLVQSDGTGGSNYGSFFYNIIRNNSSTPFWSYSGAAYSQQVIGSVAPSFIFGGTEATPTIEFYTFGGQTVSATMTIVAV